MNRINLSIDMIYWLFVLVISFYAVISTNALSILLIAPIAFLILKIRKKHEDLNSSNIALELPDIFTIIIAFAANSLYNLQFIFSFESDYIKYVAGDIYFYSNIAEFVKLYKIETTNINFLEPTLSSPLPYHYFEIWYCSLISAVLNIPTNKAILLLVYPTFAALGSFFMLNVFKNIFPNQNKTLLTIIAIIIPFLESFSQLFPSFYLDSDIYSTSINGWPKLTIVYFFISYLLLQLSKRNISNLLAASVVASAGYISLLPALFSTSFIIVAYSLLTKHKERLWHLLLISLFLYIPILYSITSRGIIEGEVLFNFGSYIFLSLKIFISGLFQYSIAIPFLIIIAFFYLTTRSKKYIPEIVFLISIGVLGLLCWSLLHPVTRESTQFFSNIFVPSILILSIIGLLIGLENKFKFVYIILPLWLLNSFMAMYININEKRSTIEASKIESIKSFIGENKPVFAHFKEDLRNVFHQNTFYTNPLRYLSILYHPYISYNICEMDSMIFENDFDFKQNTKNSPYFIFKQLYPEKNQIDFIKKYKINYILSDSRGFNINGDLKHLIKDSLVVSDKEVIYSLRPD